MIKGFVPDDDPRFVKNLANMPTRRQHAKAYGGKSI
jgi:hypothetical protein